MSRTDLYEQVTERVLAELEQGTVVWKKNWLQFGLPVNINTGKPYRGWNILGLSMAGYADPRWGTFKAMQDAAIRKAKSEGRELVIEEPKRGRRVWEIIDGERVWFAGGVKKGEKGTTGVFWRVVKRRPTPEDDDPGSYRVLRFFSLFNAQQCDEIPALVQEERTFTPIEAAQEVVDNYVSPGPGPVAVHGFAGACYRPKRDIVEMPDPENFFADDGYYHVLFHELVHSTGHEKRLGRLEPALFGTDPYGREELVAELGAAFLAAITGLQGEEQMEAAYIDGWIKAIKGDKTLVVSAAASAQRAVDLIVGSTFDDEEEPAEKELIAA